MSRRYSAIFAAAAALVCLTAGSRIACAQADAEYARALNALPPYQPHAQLHGMIRSWGHGFLKTMMRDWEEGFRKFQPGVRFDDQLLSSAAAMAGLYSGRADLGVLAREITPPEVAAYEKVTGQKIFPVTVLTGSFGDPDKIMALGVFVNRDNPIAQLTLAQLDAIFGAEHRGGAPQNLRTWGQLGLRGRWKNRPIHPYSGPAYEAPAYYFSQTVMGGSVLWNPALQQLDDQDFPDGRHVDGYRRVIDALASDPDGIALTGAGYANPQARRIRLARSAAGPYVEATPDSVVDRSYPLARSVNFYIHNGPKIAADPNVVEFLRYILSRDGQEQVLREGVFLPLNPQLAAAQRQRLPEVPGAAGETAPLRLVGRVAVPQMTGTWDHLTADAATGRLFLSAQDQQSVHVIDLRLRSAVRSIGGGFDRPQGELYLPGSDRLAVTNGADGRLLLLRGQDYRTAESIQLSRGADMMAFDPRAQLLYVESGGTDSNRGPGRLSLVDPRSGVVVGEIPTGFRAAALAMAQAGPRLYVAIPAQDQIAVVDTATRQIIARYDVPGRPASMALDEAQHRLFVATRTFAGDPRQPTFNVLDADTGRPIASLASKDGTENMFYDAAHRGVYSTSLDGFVQAYRQLDADHYELVATIPTAPHAGTSQFVPDFGLLCVAVPPQAGAPAEVWLFEPVSTVPYTAASTALPAALRLTPPPTLDSIPPQPAAPDSYEAGVVATMAPYVPEQQVSGVIRLWGHGNPKLPWMQHLVDLWQQGFQHYQPGVRLEYHMYGTSSGVPALFTGIGDIAILGEEVLPEEIAAFRKVKHYAPLAVDIATGSLDVRNFDYAQQFFVHRDNPLTHLTLSQLDSIFGAEHRRGGGNVRSWGQLGLTGGWAHAPVTPYGWALDDSFAEYLEQALLGGSHEWNCALQEFAHIYQSDGSVYDHGQQILDALARDPHGIAVSNIRYAGPDVKPLAIGVQAAGPFYQASKQTLVEQLYPLTRTIPAVIDRPPGMPVDPKVREFLRYVLSRDGQAAVIADGRYLPLAPRVLAEQRQKLD